MIHSRRAVVFTARQEHFTGRCPVRAYPMGGRLACGFGHILQPGEGVRLPMSYESGMALLNKDLFKLSQWLAPQVEVSQVRFDVLVCWLFAVHQGLITAKGQHWETAKLLEHVKSGNIQLAAAEFENWVFSPTGTLIKLARQRRYAEQYLFVQNEEAAWDSH